MMVLTVEDSTPIPLSDVAALATPGRSFGGATGGGSVASGGNAARWECSIQDGMVISASGTDVDVVR